MYTSERSAVTAIRELGAGWNVIPYDDYERGALGYCAIRPSEERTFQWALFGQPLKSEVEQVDAPTLVRFVEGEPPEALRTCDDPKSRHLGFVSYRDAANGRSVVRRTSLTQVKMLDPGTKAIFMGYRRRFGSYRDREATAKAIKPYGRLRVWLMRALRLFFPLR